MRERERRGTETRKLESTPDADEEVGWLLRVGHGLRDEHADQSAIESDADVCLEGGERWELVLRVLHLSSTRTDEPAAPRIGEQHPLGAVPPAAATPRIIEVAEQRH